MDQSQYERARKRVEKKKGFYQHLSSYVLVIGFLFLINIFTSPAYFWFIFPALGWGIGLGSHYFKVFGFPGMGGNEEEWERREMEKELRRLDAGQEDEDYLDLPELEQEQKQKKKWDDEDLV
jgi:hypothetical protein